MTKSLQILFGFVLILVLAYVAFLDVSTKIKDDLLTKTKVMFSENNIKAVTVDIQGEGLSISRSLILAGTAISEAERVRILTLTKNIEGVCHVDNQIKIYSVVPKVATVLKVPLVKKIKEPLSELLIAKSTPKEVEVIKSSDIIKTPIVEKKRAVTKTLLVPVVTSALISPVSSTKIPSVPTVETLNNNIITVPKAVTAIDTPKVIEVEKIKLEGVK